MFVLPSLFTLSSVFCGLYAIVLAAPGHDAPRYYQAAVAVFFGIFFDMADGRVARLTKTQSDFGIQLDSLADVITFGAAPAVLVYHWGLSRLGLVGAVVAFLYLGCGALRLARFNVLAARGPGSKKYFIGLPIPLAAGVLMSMVMFHQTAFDVDVVRPPSVLLLVLVLAYLMVSNVRYRSFKDLRLSSKSIVVGFLLAVSFGAVAASIQPAFALLTFFCGYVLLGLVEEVVRFLRPHERGRR